MDDNQKERMRKHIQEKMAEMGGPMAWMLYGKDKGPPMKLVQVYILKALKDRLDGESKIQMIPKRDIVMNGINMIDSGEYAEARGRFDEYVSSRDSAETVRLSVSVPLDIKKTIDKLSRMYMVNKSRVVAEAVFVWLEAYQW